MAKAGDIQYRVECLFCSKEFLVNDMLSTIPKHPSEDQELEPHISYIPCAGSGSIGAFLDTEIKGLD